MNPVKTTVPTLNEFVEKMRTVLSDQLAFDKDFGDGCSYRLITRGTSTFVELHEASIAGDYREIEISIVDVTEES